MEFNQFKEKFAKKSAKKNTSWEKRKAKQLERKSYKGNIYEEEVILDGKKVYKISWEEQKQEKPEEKEIDVNIINKIKIAAIEKNSRALNKKDIYRLKIFAQKNKYYFDLNFNDIFINKVKYHIKKYGNRLYGINKETSSLIDLTKQIDISYFSHLLLKQFSENSKAYKAYKV